MTQHQEGDARAAVTPSAHDVAVASEAILGAVGSGLVHTDHLFDLVAKRLADHPIPEVARTLAGVTEAEVRRVRAETTTLTALAELEANGALLPLGVGWPDRVIDLNYWDDHGAGGYRIEGYAFRLAPVYRRAPYATSTSLLDSPRIFLDHLPPAMGQKTRRVLREAIDAYRNGQAFAAAVLLGVASEAAWSQLARQVATKTADPKLQALLQDPRASAAAIQQRTVELVRGLKIRDIDLMALDAIEQAYRDLRNYSELLGPSPGRVV